MVNLKMEKRVRTMYFNKKVSKSGYWVDGNSKIKLISQFLFMLRPY